MEPSKQGRTAGERTSPTPLDYTAVDGFAGEKRVSIPQDATLADLWHGFPAKFTRQLAAVFCVAISASFGAGLWIGELGYVSGIVSVPSTEPFSGTRAADTSMGKDDAKRALLRKQHSVTLIERLQNDLSIDRIPNGKYGYVFGRFLEGYVPGRRLPVYQMANVFHFEVHKDPMGRLLLVGYMSRTDAVKASDPTLTTLAITLFAQRQPETDLATIDLSQATVSGVRELPNNGSYLLDIVLKR